MMEASQHGDADNHAIRWLGFGRRGHTGNGLGDALMRTGIVVVLDILRHLEQKLAFAPNEPVLPRAAFYRVRNLIEQSVTLGRGIV